MILDIGCGASPMGDINTDLYLGKSPHTKFKVDTSKNFVCCDSLFLPFKDNSFNIAYSSHLLEHVTDPLKALNEFKRVSINMVYLKIPNTMFLFNQHDRHLYAWDKKTFSNILNLVFSDVKVFCLGSEVLKGRIFKYSVLKRICTYLFNRFFSFQLIAICSKKT